MRTCVFVWRSGICIKSMFCYFELCVCVLRYTRSSATKIGITLNRLTALRTTPTLVKRLACRKLDICVFLVVHYNIPNAWFYAREIQICFMY